MGELFVTSESSGNISFVGGDASNTASSITVQAGDVTNELGGRVNLQSGDGFSSTGRVAVSTPETESSDSGSISISTGTSKPRQVAGTSPQLFLRTSSSTLSSSINSGKGISGSSGSFTLASPLFNEHRFKNTVFIVIDFIKRQSLPL